MSIDSQATEKHNILTPKRILATRAALRVTLFVSTGVEHITGAFRERCVRGGIIGRQALALTDERLASEQASSEPAAPVAPVPALPEAPASVNCYVTIAGRQVQVTLRDSDEQRLLARLTALLSQYPAPDAPKAEAHGEGWCTKHGVQMKRNQKEGRGWYSHKVGDAWCKGR